MPRASRRSNTNTSLSPARRWLATRKMVQFTSLFIFLLLFVISPQWIVSPNFINFPMRLDPLLVLSYSLSSQIIIPGAALTLIVIALSFVLGRAWCGWVCPLGTVLDLFRFSRGHNSPILDISNDSNWRKIKYSLLLAILFAALFGNLTLLIFDPITILFRTLATSLWPALDQVITALETSLINIQFFEGFIVHFDALVRPFLFPIEPVYTPAAFRFFIIFVSIIALNYISSRFWCRYLCPLGALLGLISKVSLFRRHVGQDCKGCALCERVCPTGTIDPERNYTSDPSECTLCMDCLEACPRSSIEFTPAKKIAQWREYDPSRRQALATFGLTVAGLAVISVDSQVKIRNPHLIRPPSAIQNEFLSQCIRCAECVRVCPTHALYPALLDAGLDGIWSPILIPRLGYCDYSCNRCGQVCPTQAILPLDLEDKRKQIIGKAYIDQNRCIAWADHKDCIVCEEMCPLPEKAINLKTVQWQHNNGELVDGLVPQVDRQACIGCGICENKCPVVGEAAIRVYLAN